MAETVCCAASKLPLQLIRQGISKSENAVTLKCYTLQLLALAITLVAIVSPCTDCE